MGFHSAFKGLISTTSCKHGDMATVSGYAVCPKKWTQSRLLYF